MRLKTVSTLKNVKTLKTAEMRLNFIKTYGIRNRRGRKGRPPVFYILVSFYQYRRIKPTVKAD